MEGDEAGELKENAEKGSADQAMRPVAFTMSLLAVLVAITTVLGHRTHTEAVLTQNQATDQWNYYQSHNIRDTVTRRADQLLGVLDVNNPEGAKQLEQQFAADQARWSGDMAKAKDQAEQLEKKVRTAEARAGRFDLAEALLEIGLVITSVTLLTRSRIYWYFGFVFAAAGALSAASAFLVM